MADTSKAQKVKLANSRKKFKELQELRKKKHDKIVDDVKNTKNPTPIDSMTSSSHSSINNEVSEIIDNSVYIPNASNIADDCALFFDNFDQKGHSEDFQENQFKNMANYFDLLPNDTIFSKIPTHENVSDTVNDQDKIQLPQNSDCVDNVEEKQLIHIHDNLYEQTPRNLEKDSDFINNKLKNLAQIEDTTEDNSECEIIDTSNQVKLEIQHSNVESLKQLSNQMAELIQPQFQTLNSSCNYNYSITDLEKRNLELATLLEQEKVKTEKNSILMRDLQNKVSYLEDVIKEKDEKSSFQISREIGKLKEELQSHLQTIGMLVAEKTELSVTLSKFETSSKQKSSECEELQARLKASRSRVADLEKEISNFKLDKCQNEAFVQESNELVNILKRDLHNIKEQKEELMQDFLETKEKLKNALEENLKLQQSHQELTSRLDLANIKLQQISTIDQQHIERELGKITEEKFNLEKQLTDVSQLLKTLTKERDESVSQYQQYAQQQNMQLTSLSKRVEELQLENENLSLQEQNRIKHISELEKQLQNLQVEQVALATDKISTGPSSKVDFEKLQELCVQLQMEKTVLEESYTKVSNEKDMLLKELEAKNDSLSQLEGLVEQLQGNQPDSVKLLATMESDKIAAARAVQQNKELKQHIESLEEVFLKLNNDKVELTEQVNREIKSNKVLLQKLQKTEVHFQRLTEAVEIKDRELMDLRQDIAKLEKQNLQNEQVHDLLRHYEVQDNNSFTLQNELKEAKEVIVRLTNEINILKHNLNDNKAKSQTDLITEQLKPEVDEDNINLLVTGKDDGTETVSDLNKTLDREIAVKYLEEKFKRTMQDIVDLKEEKQSLEHLVLQLQGETETIGEYVALYHHQRMILKQRALEKDQQLTQLTNDREYLKTKLEKLDNLIKELVHDHNIAIEPTPKESDLTNDNTNYCEKHSSLRNEIINVSNETNGVNNDHSLDVANNIIKILSEIKSSNLVQPKENVHHCAWCSGQLMTV